MVVPVPVPALFFTVDRVSCTHRYTRKQWPSLQHDAFSTHPIGVSLLWGGAEWHVGEQVIPNWVCCFPQMKAAAVGLKVTVSNVVFTATQHNKMPATPTL